MLIKISQLAHLGLIDKIVIHSIDISLYQVSIEVNGQTLYVTNDKGEHLRAFNALELQRRMRDFDYKQMVLRHESVYDEMIGLESAQGTKGNALEVSLGDNDIS